MYRMIISYVEKEGYRVAFDYLNNDYQESYETITGLSKNEVNELIDNKPFYIPFYKNSEISKMW